MAPRTTPPKIAVIGLGPRGLGALESLAAQVRQADVSLSVDVFDALPACGAGPNFDPDESRFCLLNIPMRDIAIRPPGFTRVGGFADWLEDAPGPDVFPARADLGRYLEARWSDLTDLGLLALTLRAVRVEAVQRVSGGWVLQAEGQRYGPYAEVLLTPGQPEVRPDPQLTDWQAHSGHSSGRLMQAYPARDLAAAAADWAGQTVAIRGLALSAFDVLRALTTAQGGRFDGGRYHASGREPARVVPFSLDGKPPFPKPGTEALDARFAPLDEETAVFERAIGKAASGSAEEVAPLITSALVPVVARILPDAGAAQVEDWLATEWETPGAQEGGGPVETLQDGIAMAAGQAEPTIGYVVGQVWRKWQDPLRIGYNPAETPPETAQKIIDFDEGLKRYSYGPPLSASVELAALIEAGLVDLDLSADPGIEMVDKGWALTLNGRTEVARVMIDGVMPSPDPEAVTAEPVAGLVKDGRMSVLAEGLAARTAADGTLIGADGQAVPGLCLLGRLALGSVVASDSLHDCFGASGQRWAEGVIKRTG
ncbi:FAD/NAD(P)-binding protein [Antarctobacter jejuensis]|uniref:FAD/NAD(P)-binding protein n=1 Tax=Antarctobacter jejuensis TaxID=1439938 RepID=UPI003FD38921